MLPISKFALMVNDLTAAAAATHLTGYVDTLGCDFCTINFAANPGHTTATNNPTVFKLGESADTYMTNATDIASFVGYDTAALLAAAGAGFVIPNVPTVTTTPYAVQMNVDTRALARYLHLEVVPLGASMTATAHASLFRAEQLPNTTTESGVLAVVNG